MSAVIEYQGHAVASAQTATDIRAHVQRIQEVMKAVMKQDVHYGTIPGTGKPTLYKAGSEVLLSTFRIAVEVSVEDLSANGEVHYRVKALGRHQTSGTVIGEGVGERTEQRGAAILNGAVFGHRDDADVEVFVVSQFGAELRHGVVDGFRAVADRLALGLVGDDDGDVGQAEQAAEFLGEFDVQAVHDLDVVQVQQVLGDRDRLGVGVADREQVGGFVGDGELDVAVAAGQPQVGVEALHRVDAQAELFPGFVADHDPQITGRGQLAHAASPAVQADQGDADGLVAQRVEPGQ